ncbi:hypothetical protein RO575_17345 [Methylomonas sp. MO1]|uniref:hypothetical protein n=1 Tax=unclassified Methylomonas TaxID=2608980 RepID=UPI000478BF51|nr:MULTISPECIES: hypothetical protein [unclassified Methylomonas]MDT4291333.1 hypothetical protein [Methylomonas sp. MO1]
MNQLTTISALLLAGMASVSGAASAATTTTTINFDGLNQAAYGGHANTSATGVCADCYAESGFVLGVVSDANPTNHLHQELNDIAPDGVTPLYEVAYHNDSSGIYMRAVDGSSFSLTQMDFHSPWGISNGNRRSGSWEILGFSQPDNAALSSGDGTNYATRVAYQTLANTATDNFDGTLVLNSGFQNISAFWIHFIGEPDSFVTAGLPYKMRLDNVVIQQTAAAVPVPAAVWMFGSGLLGLLSFGRKKNSLAA